MKPWSPLQSFTAVLSPRACLRILAKVLHPGVGHCHPHTRVLLPQDLRPASMGTLQPSLLCAVTTKGVTRALEGAMSLDWDCGDVSGTDLWSLSPARCSSPAPAA